MQRRRFNVNRRMVKKMKIFVDETLLKVDEQEYWLWIAYEPNKSCLMMHLSRERTIFVCYEVASSTDFPAKEGGEGYDLVAFFDSLHDMGDPSGAASHVLQTLKPDGTWMIVEPFANDKLEDNLNPIGRIFYAVSTLICVPASLAHNGPALGAQSGEHRISELVKAVGFKHFKRATQTPFNLIYEAKP
jgi:hypothetical protein